MEITDAGARVHLFSEDSRDGFTAEARRATVQVAGDGSRIAGVGEPPRSQHLREHTRVARNHQGPGPGGDEDDAPAAPRVLEGELLGQRSAPGQAEDVDDIDPDLGEEAAQAAREGGIPYGTGDAGEPRCRARRN